MAEKPFNPVRNRIGISSEFFNASAPCSTSRSRGRSPTGKSLMRLPAITPAVNNNSATQEKKNQFATDFEPQINTDSHRSERKGEPVWRQKILHFIGSVFHP